jgi:hypothetical protein
MQREGIEQTLTQLRDLRVLRGEENQTVYVQGIEVKLTADG